MGTGERFSAEFEVETCEEVVVGTPSFVVDGKGFDGREAREAHNDDYDSISNGSGELSACKNMSGLISYG